MKKLTALVLAIMLVFAAGSALALTDREAVNIEGQVIGGTTLNIITMTPLGFAKDQTINWAVYGLGTETTYSIGQDVIFLAQFMFASASDDLTSWWTQYKKIKIACTNMVFKGIAAAGIVDPTTNKITQSLATKITNNIGTAAEISFSEIAESYSAGRQLNVVFTAAIVANDPSLSVQAAWGPGMTFATADTGTTVAGATAGKVFKLFELKKGKYVDSNFTVRKANVLGLIWDTETNPVYTIAYTGTDAAYTTLELSIVLKQDRGTVDHIELTGAFAAPAWVQRSTNVGGTTTRNWEFYQITAPVPAAAPLPAERSKIAAASAGPVAGKVPGEFINNVFDVLGFDWQLNGAVWDEDFMKYSNFAKDAVAVAPNMLGAVVPEDPEDPTDPGDIDIPITGDVASTFGFVMIGVAILATASLAVVAKKAR